MSVSNKTIYYGESVQLVATVKDKNTEKYVTGGNVAFKINGVTVGYANLTDGKAYLTYDSTKLSVNTYNISASFSGTSQYNATKTITNGQLNVLKHDSQITVSNKTITAGSKIQLVATVTDKYTGKYATSGSVAFKVNGNTVGYGNVSNGKAYFTYDSSKLSAKTYTLSASYGGSSTLNSARTTSNSNLVVNKHNASITISSKTIPSGSKVQLVVTVFDKTTNSYATSGKVAFKVNSKTVGYANISNGKAYYTYDSSKLSVGTYTLSASYGGNSLIYSNKTTNNNKLVVTKHNASITISNNKIYYGQNVQLVVTVVDKTTNSYATSGNVAFKVNGKTVGYANISNGNAYYTYDSSKLSVGTYTLSATYSGNSVIYSNRTNENSKLEIRKDTVSITISNKTDYKNNNVQLVVTVANKITGKYADGGKVAFKVNGKTVGYSTISNGKAYYTYNTSKLNAGTYSLSASYGGTNQVTSAKASGSTLKLSLRPVTMTISNKTVSSGDSRSVKLVVTVVDKQTNNYATGGTVVFKVGGVTVGRSALTKGKAYFTYTFNAVGGRNYTLTATYSGSGTYDSGSTPSNSKLTVTQSISFSYSQIKDAAVYLRNHYEANDIITTVPIGSTTIGVEDFLPIMIKMVKNINNGKSSSKVTYVDYEGVSSQSDTISTKTLKKSEMISIGNSVLTFYQNNGRAPRYATYGSEQIGFYNLVYSFAKMLDLSSSNSLPSTCKVYKWSTIHPSNSKSRTIYLTSDVIYNSATDRAFMNSIKKGLEARGYTVVISGYGPNSHNTKIRSQSLPSNAVQVSIFGGADAGVIYDVCTRSYMRLKENRLEFFVYYPTAKDITGLSWLPRAHDDNYSPSSFKGISHPDKYLEDHGYGYVYSGNVNTIVEAIIKYIS